MWWTIRVALAQADGACFPECSPGYLCHEGQCIEACNPKCTAGWRCTAARVCEVVPGAPAVRAPSAAASSSICVYRRDAGEPGAWDLGVDGLSVGALDPGRYRCFSVQAGVHVVRVSRVARLRTGLAVTGFPIAKEIPAASFTTEVRASEAGRAGLFCYAAGKAGDRLECATAAPEAIPGFEQELRPM